MGKRNLLAEVHKMVKATYAIAALGAELRLSQEGVAGDSAVRSRLKVAVEAIAPGTLATLPPRERDEVLSTILVTLHEALDLVSDPARPPGWTHRDPVLLQAKGETSRGAIRHIARLVASRPAVAALLDQPGEILDVGTGVGCIALEAAAT